MPSTSYLGMLRPLAKSMGQWTPHQASLPGFSSAHMLRLRDYAPDLSLSSRVYEMPGKIVYNSVLNLSPPSLYLNQGKEVALEKGNFGRISYSSDSLPYTVRSYAAG
jgi:hypothetical protein